MRLTKLEHSCMILERDGAQIVIDPGGFTTLVTEPTRVVAVVVTHEHADHWTPEQLAAISQRNTRVTVYAPRGAAEAIGAAAIPGLGPVVTVGRGDELSAGPFRLRFYGGVHAEIHRSYAPIDNVGVVVDDTIAYGGDAYDLPSGADGRPLDGLTLAVPANAPWMRLSESMDLIERARPAQVFAVHDMLLSRAGMTLATERLREAADRVGATLLELQPYLPVELPERAPS